MSARNKKRKGSEPPSPSLSLLTLSTPQPWSESSLSFPYETEYADHFETPLQAYKDVAPLWDALRPDRRRHRLYDPYYCNGRTQRLLRDELGFPQVIHARRDFYEDIAKDKVPAHDTLVSNPPYSDNHKERCLDFCFQQLQTATCRRPFFLLLPNYVAARDYYRQRVEGGGGGGGDSDHEISDGSSGQKGAKGQTQQSQTKMQTQEDVVYLVPSQPYQYDHPEGTGHAVSPFASLWYCGVGADRVADMQTAADKAGVRLYTSLEALRQARIIPTERRPNPRQRRKQQNQRHAGDTSNKPSVAKASLASKKPKTNKSGRHRNSEGVRTKQRF